MVKILEIFSVIFMQQMFFHFFQNFTFQKICQPILAIPKMSRVNAKPTAALDTQIRVSRCIYTPCMSRNVLIISAWQLEGRVL